MRQEMKATENSKIHPAPVVARALRASTAWGILGCLMALVQAPALGESPASFNWGAPDLMGEFHRVQEQRSSQGLLQVAQVEGAGCAAKQQALAKIGIPDSRAATVVPQLIGSLSSSSAFIRQSAALHYI